MKAFHSAQEAKEFLVSKIVAEAQIEGVSLSEVERKMLYFSETCWTLPDIMEVNDAFDREYDSSEFERKIAALIRKTDKRLRKASPEEYESWWSAIRFLKKEDHYLSVMISIAGLRPSGDQLKLFLTGLAVASCLLVLVFLRVRYDRAVSRYLPPRDAIWLVLWLFGACAAIVYLLLGFILGTKSRNDLVSKGLEALVRIYQRVR